jgi:hypothetical protein
VPAQWEQEYNISSVLFLVRFQKTNKNAPHYIALFKVALCDLKKMGSFFYLTDPAEQAI